MDRTLTTLLDACRGTVPASWSFRAARFRTLLAWRVRLFGVSVRVRILRLPAALPHVFGPQPVDLFPLAENDTRVASAEARPEAAAPVAAVALPEPVPHLRRNPAVRARPADVLVQRRSRSVNRPKRTPRRAQPAELEASA
jgi:hypothetical protein